MSLQKTLEESSPMPLLLTSKLLGSLFRISCNESRHAFHFLFLWEPFSDCAMCVIIFSWIFSSNRESENKQFHKKAKFLIPLTKYNSIS